MQQLLSPILLIKIAKSYLSELNRIWTLNEQQLADYKDKAFNKMVKYAYENVPLLKNFCWFYCNTFSI